MARFTALVKGLTLLCFFQVAQLSNATTIIPYENLGHLARESDHVLVARVLENFEEKAGDVTNYRSKLRVLNPIKSQLNLGESFTIDKWEQKVGEMIRVMWGDIHLEEGKTYLLFLADMPDGSLQPICFSYYLFEEIHFEGEIIMQPSEYSKEFILVEEFPHEPLVPFRKKQLLEHLQEVVEYRTEWNSRTFRLSEDLYASAPDHQRAAPNHCSFLGTSNNFRWLNLPDQPIEVHYAAAGDAGCSGAHEMIQHAVDSLNIYYGGINLIDGGTFSGFIPDCASGTSQGSNLPDYISSNYGSSRHTLVQFDDPCNKIPSLSGCSGTLAVGGLYGIGTHLYDGNTWWTGAYGYVVVNNGVGSCMCSMGTYGSMITHELTHTLGLGHISSLSGPANMNPSCCNEIENLDLDCVNYVYESSAILPVELVDFQAEGGEVVNWIAWETASEINSDYFVVERSIDAKESSFTSIGTLPAAGNRDQPSLYELIDKYPAVHNYYRLKSVDLDGSTQYSEIIYLRRHPKVDISVYPTDVEDRTNVRIPSSYIGATVDLIHPSGKLIRRVGLHDEYNLIDMHDLPPGIYLIRVLHSEGQSSFKVRKF
ncbi:MAG: zinc-dependent metalloprotease [Saprospiraceae bacterium]|nr:zinc-dependent metalloprotease [Saprospiraceae bacterium]